jgi:hypothetical protein
LQGGVLKHALQNRELHLLMVIQGITVMTQQPTEQSSQRQDGSHAVAWSWLRKSLIAFLITIWSIPCLLVTTVWIVEEVGGRPGFPSHLHGLWSYRLNQNWGGEICLELFHDFPKPNVGPKLGPGKSYTPEALAWYDKLQVAVYRGTAGFDHNVSPNYEITPGGNMELRGTQTDLRMPEWAAVLMWLPLLIFCLRRLKKRRDIRKGLCGSCGYDLRATPNRCPECGAIPVQPLKIIWKA